MTPDHEDRRPPVAVAAETGDLAEVRRILDSDPAQIRATSQLGSVGPHTPLHLAARHGYLEVARLLLDRGAEPDTRGEFGQTPLHLAVKGRQPETVELLLARGADPDLPDDGPARPLDFAMFGFDPDDRIIAMLEAAGATIDLCLALKFGRREVAWERLRAGEPHADDPSADLTLSCSTGGMCSLVSIELARDGRDETHLDPTVRVPATRRVVDEHIDLLDALVARPLPVTRRSLVALQNAFALWDARPAERLVAAGVLRPHADRLADRRFLGGLAMHVRLVNQLNPFRLRFEELLAENGIELAGVLPGAG